MQKKYKKAQGIRSIKGIWYYRNRRKNDKEQLITLQTKDELIALNRVRDILPFKKYLRDGSISREEVLSKCKWYLLPQNQIESNTLEFYLNKWLEIRKVDVKESTFKRNMNSIKSFLNLNLPESDK